MEEKEDLKDLQFLISNKQQKSYTRMVSQEFSCAESHVPVQGSRRQRRSKKSSSSSINAEIEECASSTVLSPDHDAVDILACVFGDENEDSEGSEYFSAEEGHDDCVPDGSISTDDYDESDEKDKCETVDPIKEEKKARTSTLSSEHTKAPNKRQKKKRRELAKTEGPLFPFGNTDFIDTCVDFSELKEGIALTAERSVFNEVPSLVELCLFASRKLSRENRAQTLIPGRIKSILKLSNNRIRLQKFQLSWLFKLLPLVECDVSIGTMDCPKGELQFAYRNIWCSDMYSKNVLLDYDASHCYYSTSATCYLPHTFVWNTVFHSQMEHLLKTFQLSAMANIIDLMLPPTIPHKTIHKKQLSNSQSEEDILSADTDRMLLRVKSELEKKFPMTIKCFYHQVLPYVFWARGLIPKAAHLFSDLASKEKKYRKKARYLYEVGRMYSHFDEAEVAVTFFKGAKDAVLLEPKNRIEKISHVVEQQTRILCADAYDQGPMTAQKAQQAINAWSVAIRAPDARQLSAPLPGMYAADSLLCFHAGIGRGDVMSWLHSCVERLEEISQSCPEVYLYLSQVYAWVGLAKDSATAYRKYLNTGYKSTSDSTLPPGQLLGRSGRYEKQPWRVLLQMVQSATSGTPKPLSVLWRTRLGPPRFCVTDTHGSWEADRRSSEVNLTLSKDGKITGDLQLLLPSIRGVQLDPYTGILSFPHMPGETYQWKSSDFRYRHDQTSGNFHEPTLIPTPMELYCDHYGNRVHLLSSPMKVKRNEEKPSSHVLFWTGADGRRSKVNLNAKVKQSVYEDIKNRASKELSNEKNKNPLRGKYNRHPFICHLNSPARFSSTIAIPVSFQPNQDGVSKGIVFVDCSCLETFLEIKVSIKNFGELYSGQPVWETTSVSRMLIFQHSDLLPILVSPSEVKYYDKYGEEFDNVYISDVNIECCVPQVYRNLVLYVNQENNLVKSLNGDGLTVEHFDFVDKMVVCRNVIIMFNKERLIFADTISLLPLEVLITDRIHTSLPNGVVYQERIKHLNVIGEKEIKKESGITCNMVAIAMDTHLIVVEIPLCEEPEFVEIKMCVEVPGLAKDICFISPHAGFLVSVTQHDKADYLPRETLYHLESSGRLQGLLPGLGKGPRSFLPLMLSAEGTESDRKAWHIYLRDGHDGIMCIRLD